VTAALPPAPPATQSDDRGGARRLVAVYMSRHVNPWNRALHLLGVPMAPFLGAYLLIRGRVRAGAGLLVAGYALQWLGHRAEGSELGEWGVIKRLAGRLGRER
jgi:hypothetical protein